MSVTIDIASAGKYIVIIAFAAVIIFAVMMLVGNVRRYFAGRGFERSDRESMRRRWQEIMRMSGGEGETGRRVALMEADKLLDHALKSLAMPGTTLGERLKFAQYKHPELRDVWPAHRIRNQLAHEAGYHLDSAVARKAMKSFERALQRLGAI